MMYTQRCTYAILNFVYGAGVRSQTRPRPALFPRSPGESASYENGRDCHVAPRNSKSPAAGPQNQGDLGEPYERRLPNDLRPIPALPESRSPQDCAIQRPDPTRSAEGRRKQRALRGKPCWSSGTGGHAGPATNRRTPCFAGRSVYRYSEVPDGEGKRTV